MSKAEIFAFTFAAVLAIGLIYTGITGKTVDDVVAQIWSIFKRKGTND